MTGHSNKTKGHRVVISGVAGRFPNSDSITELQVNLFNKIDCVTADHGRWEFDSPKIPQSIGKCNNIGKFDRVFFGVHTKLTDVMEPTGRMLLEHTYEAIIDAGINPKTLRGANVNVYTATNLSESEKAIFNIKVQRNGFGIMGGSKAMIPNRVSFFLGLHGSSLNLDNGCAGSASALDRAYIDIRDGNCDAAIVAGCCLSLHPHVSYQLKALGQLSADGKTRCFDDSADGHTRSDGVSVLFLQRAQDAKRIYQEIVHVSQFYSAGEQVNTIIYPKLEAQIKAMKDTLKHSGLTPDDISYMEATGCGLKKYDAEELRAIDTVYGKRKEPLLVGSIKSCIGDAIAANTTNAIIKVIIASETGLIPPNLHYETPNSEAPSLIEGRAQIPTELTPWTGPYSSVNVIAVGGTVANVILKAPNIEKKNDGRPKDKLQRLIVASGRTEKAVKEILNYVEKKPLDVEFLQMLYDVFESGVDNHLYRGYIIMPTEIADPTLVKTTEIAFNTGESNEVWWVFSGMGSQWAGMGEALLKLPVFEAAIKKCDNVLKPLGYDIYKIITDKDPSAFDKIINSFIGIAAIQIGLVDVLRAVGLEPDHIIGHSVGELGCAYADGCFTAEQMILAAMSRGLASMETDLIQGSMAAVGLGYEDIKPLCPPDIDVACHNGPESSTISGPAQSMKDFVANLTAKGIFAREVPCSNIAYHSRYIAAAGTKLLERLHKVIPDPKPRSAKWVSSSVPRAEWNSLKARLCSAEYHTNNLLNPVLFEETSRLIPANAICIEIAPHGLLQAILKRSLDKTCINIALTRRGHADNLEVLLSALGKMYNVGLNPQISNLYPKIQYPVGRGTPSLSSLIRWDHSTDWDVRYHNPTATVQKGKETLDIDLNSEDFAYLQGNVINGKIAIPLSLCLIKTWQLFDRYSENPKLKIVFENIQVHKLILNVPDDGKISLTFDIFKGTGTFEVLDSESILLSGGIKPVESPNQERLNLFETKGKAEKTYELNAADFYEEMKMRGFSYDGQFRNVSKASIEGEDGIIKWNNDWGFYIDGALQFYTFGHDTRQVEVPLSIRKIVIDNDLHESTIKSAGESQIFVDKKMNCLSAGGLEIQGIKLSVIPKVLEQSRLSADTSVIVPNVHESIISIATGLRLILQLVLENIFISKIPVIQIVKESNEERIHSDLVNYIPEASLFKVEYNVRNKDATFNKALTIIEDKITNYDVAEISGKVGNSRFILIFISSADLKSTIKLLERNNFRVVFMRKFKNEYFVLLRKKQRITQLHSIDASQNMTDCINKIRNIKVQSEHERIIVTVKPGVNISLDDLKSRLQSSLNLEKIRIFDFRNVDIPNHSLSKLLEVQIESDMFVNILTAESTWSTLRRSEVTLKPQLCKNWRANQKYLHDPTTLIWTEGPPALNSKSTIKVEYSSLNPQDLLIVDGSFHANSSVLLEKHRLEPISIGLEFSGTDSKGNRVMGIARGNAMSNYVQADEDWVWDVPKNWSLENAATVPLSYVIAYTACCLKAEIHSEDKVMITNPCTEHGLAVLNLAIQKKSDVFVRYETEEERKLLQNAAPSLNENRMFKSSDESFRDSVFKATEGQGVDVMFCAESRDIELYFSILRHHARVILISDFAENKIHENIGMTIFFRELNFFSVVPKKVLDSDSQTRKILAKFLKDGIAAGHVKPLPKIVFERESLNEALTACRGNKCLTKIVVKTQPEGSKTSEALAIPRIYCSESNSHLILEGLTEFGLELIDWLVTRGARNFVVTSTSTVNNGYAKLRMKYWNDYGVRVTLHENFIYSDEKNIKVLFKEAQSLGPLDGLFDLRLMSLTDKKLLDSFEAVTLVLDGESRRCSNELRLFAIFSTIKNAENDITRYSDTVIKKLLNKRKGDGKPGLHIKWELIDTATSNNIISLPASKYLQKLDDIFGTEDSVVSVSYSFPTNNEIEEDLTESSTVVDLVAQEREIFLAGLNAKENVDSYEGLNGLSWDC